MHTKMNEKVPALRRTQVAHLVALTLTSAVLINSTAIAQDRESADALEEVVVIGTAGGKGVDRVDASFAVTTYDDKALERIQPKSTADLLKAVPGIWAESSGGVAGANIDVRGLPGGGDAPFASFSINGSPLFGTNTLSFFEGSTLFRVDETVAGVEALRGGPNAVFAKGEPGATINFKLKEGSEETIGRVKYTTSDYELQRFDGFVSGKIADDLYYAVGGYVQSSPGIRDAQFSAEKGQQITINLTKEFDNGKINFYIRDTDDHSQWYLPINLANPNIDVGTFSQLGNANVNFVSGDANTRGFVPSGTAITAMALSNSLGRPIVTQSGRQLGAGSFVQTYGHWVVDKELESFSNDISISKNFADRHDVTFGLYTSSFSSDDWWSIGNPIAVENTQNGEILADVTPGDIAAAGGDGGFNFGLTGSGDARVTALYLADSIAATEALSIDLGIRYEEIEIDYIADLGPGFADGSNDVVTSVDGDEVALTAAVNYAFSDDFGLFFRYSDGFRFPGFDNLRENQNQVNDVEQFEGGAKYSGENFNL